MLEPGVFGAGRQAQFGQGVFGAQEAAAGRAVETGLPWIVADRWRRKRPAIVMS
jgi:hypothetical protein